MFYTVSINKLHLSYFLDIDKYKPFTNNIINQII